MSESPVSAADFKAAAALLRASMSPELPEGELYVRHDCPRRQIIGRMRDMRPHGPEYGRWGVVTMKRTSVRQRDGGRGWTGADGPHPRRRRSRTQRFWCQACGGREIQARIGRLCQLADAAIEAGEDSILVA